MPTQNEEFSSKIKPKIHAIKPIESEELEDLGAEIEAELTAEEKAELKAKQSPKEQIANFYNTDEWAAWKTFPDTIESTDKIVARNGLLMELAALEKQVSNDPDSLRAIALIREELTAGHA